MIRLRAIFSVFLLTGIFLSGCEKATWEQQERQQIKDFIKSVGDSAYTLYPSGLYYLELKAGTGRAPVDNDTAYFKYKARFLDYVIFNTNIPITKPYMHVMGTEVGPVISGIDEGLRYMKAGGSARLLTPSSLAYGFEGIWQIVPGYTPLLWDIELDSVKAGHAK